MRQQSCHFAPAHRCQVTSPRRLKKSPGLGATLVTRLAPTRVAPPKPSRGGTNADPAKSYERSENVYEKKGARRKHSLRSRSQLAVRPSSGKRLGTVILGEAMSLRSSGRSELLRSFVPFTQDRRRLPRLTAQKVFPQHDLGAPSGRQRLTGLLIP